MKNFNPLFLLSEVSAYIKRAAKAGTVFQNPLLNQKVANYNAGHKISRNMTEIPALRKKISTVNLTKAREAQLPSWERPKGELAAALQRDRQEIIDNSKKRISDIRKQPEIQKRISSTKKRLLDKYKTPTQSATSPTPVPANPSPTPSPTPAPATPTATQTPVPRTGPRYYGVRSPQSSSRSSARYYGVRNPAQAGSNTSQANMDHFPLSRFTSRPSNANPAVATVNPYQQGKEWGEKFGDTASRVGSTIGKGIAGLGAAATLPIVATGTLLDD